MTNEYQEKEAADKPNPLLEPSAAGQMAAASQDRLRSGAIGGAVSGALVNPSASVPGGSLLFTQIERIEQATEAVRQLNQMLENMADRVFGQEPESPEVGLAKASSPGVMGTLDDSIESLERAIKHRLLPTVKRFEAL